MVRAMAKGAALWVFGYAPGGPAIYRRLTRGALGTQATHADKLSRVWPGYVRVWRETCGVELEGSRLWIHDGGWTVFPFLLGHMVTGRGPIVTNEEGAVLDRYTRRALEAAEAIDLGVCVDRTLVKELLKAGTESVAEVVAKTGGTLLEHVQVGNLPIESESVDLAHSGGTLEHYPPARLEAFLRESWRILRPGGIASHVFDHRDHLYHADKRYPFLNHLRYGELGYRVRLGHPLLYHNRLLPAQVVEAFERAGFERVAVRRLILPDLKYVEGDELPTGALVGLERSRLHPRFGSATDADLRTAAAHYLFRKPS
jgi:SAM-dependent methyltransferase